MKKTRTQIEVSKLQLNTGQMQWLPKNPRQWTQTDLDRTKQSITEDEDLGKDDGQNSGKGVKELIVIATENERELLPLLKLEGRDVLVVGVGGTNVIKALQDISRDTPIINVGYAGSLNIPINSVVKIGECRLHHVNADYDEPIYNLGGDVACYSGCDFVTKSNIPDCVFDMELAFICAMGFQVQSIKVVSDNLNYEQYERNI